MASTTSSTLRIDHLPQVGESLVSTGGKALGTVVSVSRDDDRLTVGLVAAGGSEHSLNAMQVPGPAATYEVVSMTYPDFESVDWSRYRVPRRIEMPLHKKTAWTDPTAFALPVAATLKSLLPTDEVSWWVEDAEGNLHLVSILDSRSQQQALTGHESNSIMLLLVNAVTLMISSSMSSDERTQRDLYWKAIQVLITLGVAKEETDGS